MTGPVGYIMLNVKYSIWRAIIISRYEIVVIRINIEWHNVVCFTDCLHGLTDEEILTQLKSLYN